MFIARKVKKIASERLEKKSTEKERNGRTAFKNVVSCFLGNNEVKN